MTHRIRPSWTPGTAYVWRDIERDVADRVRFTDLDDDKHGPAVFQRLGGMAKILACETPENIVVEGAPDAFRNHRPGLSVLMDGSPRPLGRRSPEPAARTVAGLRRFRPPMLREDYEDALTRLNVCRTRARDEGGSQGGLPSLTRMLLFLFHVPGDQWATILVPTQGMTPINGQQFNYFNSYLKRHLALFRRSNVMHPVPPPSLAGGHPRDGVAPRQHYTTTTGDNIWNPVIRVLPTRRAPASP